MPWAVAAAAVAAGGAYLSADKQAKAVKGAGSDPYYVEQGKKSAIERAERIADKPYTPYTGQRVAGITGNETEASQLARTGGEKARGFFDQAGSKLGELKDYSKENLDAYTNPYIESVLQPQLREQNADYERSRSKLLNSDAGAWGGDRAAFSASELERTHRNAIADVTGKTYSDAFGNAQQAFFADQDRKMRAADSYRALGGDVTRMNTQQIQDLMATGGVQRMLSQADLDFDYQQFVENRDWDTNNLEPLLKAISVSKGAPLSSKSGPSPWGQALGAAATVAGMYFTGGSNTNFNSAGSGAMANSALADAGFGAGWTTPQIQP